jgi:hypothetical protein
MVSAVAIFVLCVLSPVVHVHIPQSTHEELQNTTGQKKVRTEARKVTGTKCSYNKSSISYLQFIFIENLDEILWY